MGILTAVDACGGLVRVRCDCRGAQAVEHPLLLSATVAIQVIGMWVAPLTLMRISSSGA